MPTDQPEKKTENTIEVLPAEPQKVPEINRPKFVRGQQRLSKEKIAEILCLRDQGWTQTAIAQELGVSRISVCKYINEFSKDVIAAGGGLDQVLDERGQKKNLTTELKQKLMLQALMAYLKEMTDPGRMKEASLSAIVQGFDKLYSNLRLEQGKSTINTSVAVHKTFEPDKFKKK